MLVRITGTEGHEAYTKERLGDAVRPWYANYVGEFYDVALSRDPDYPDSFVVLGLTGETRGMFIRREDAEPVPGPRKMITIVEDAGGDYMLEVDEGLSHIPLDRDPGLPIMEQLIKELGHYPPALVRFRKG